MTENSSIESADFPSEPERETCPTPLLWQDIVLSFHEFYRQGPLEFPGGTLTATQFGSGLPLVFLPGTLCTPRLYALTTHLLQEERQCWILGHPDFETTPSESERINKSAIAYSSVLEDLFGGPVEVYASDYAVPVCLELLRVAPDAVKSAVLQSGWGHRSLTTLERILLGIGRRLPFKLKRIPLWKSSQIQNHRSWFPPYDETRFSFLLSETSEVSTSDVCRRFLASAKIDKLSDLAATTQPILVLRTEGDGKYISKQADDLEAALPNCESMWLHTSGHYPFLTHPHRLVKVLRDFFPIPQKEPLQTPLMPT